MWYVLTASICLWPQLKILASSVCLHRSSQAWPSSSAVLCLPRYPRPPLSHQFGLLTHKSRRLRPQGIRVPRDQRQGQGSPQSTRLRHPQPEHSRLLSVPRHRQQEQIWQKRKPDFPPAPPAIFKQTELTTPPPITVSRNHLLRVPMVERPHLSPTSPPRLPVHEKRSPDAQQSPLRYEGRR